MKKLTKNEERFDKALECAGFDYLEEMQKIRLWGFDPEETQRRVDKVHKWWDGLSREEKKEYYDKYLSDVEIY